MLEGAKNAADHRRAGRARPRRRRWPCCRSRRRPPQAVGAVTRGLERLLRAAHRRRARRRARSRLRAGRGRPRLRAAMARPAALDVLFLLGADEIDDRARRLRRLSGHAWRSRRAPRRRHPAGRGLHRKVRHLRQHRGPGADRRPRRLPAGRCARGLGDPARALRRARRSAAVRFACSSCAQRSMRRIRISPRIDTIAASDAARPCRRSPPSAAQPGRARFRRPRRRFLPDQPDRARLRASWPNARRCRAAVAAQAAE